MSDKQGWIKLYRKIQDNPLWTEKRVFSRAEAWIDILIEVRHDEKPANVLIGSTLVVCNRGQCIKSLDTWALRWGWNKSAVRRFFELLQNMEQIRHESATKTTRLTVCNYDTYNQERNGSETETKRKRNALDTHLTPNKNGDNGDNEDNEDKVGDPPLPFTKWTIDDLRKSVSDHNKDGLLSPSQAEEFCHYWIDEVDGKGRSKLHKEKTWSTRGRMQTSKRLIHGGSNASTKTTFSHHEKPRPSTYLESDEETKKKYEGLF